MALHIDIVLVYPKTGMDFASTVAPPHALLSVAAPLHKEGYKIEIIDQRTNRNWKVQLEKALEASPLCVGISTMTGTQIFHALEAAKIVRNKTNGNIPIIWGGVHPSSLPEQTLKSEFVDIVCIGEGEETFSELIHCLQSKGSLENVAGIAYKNADKIIATTPRPLMDVEKLLPVPWELINAEDYIHPDMYLKGSPRTLDIGQTSRGCPFNCTFCSSATIRQRKWRPMSVERSLEAIVEPVRRFKLTGIWIRDDEFYINRARANNICEGMIQTKLNIHWYTSGTRIDVFNKATEDEIALLKRSGAYVLKFGAESGSERILKLMNKGITPEDTIKANMKAKRHNIIPVFALMVGFPTETFKEIHQTIDLALKLKKDNPKAQFESIAPLLVLPCTPIFDLAIKMGLKPPQSLNEWGDWIIDEYDLEGIRIPWFNLKERKLIGNLCYIYMLANALPNAFDGVKNRLLKTLFKVASTPFIYYYRFLFKRKMYRFAPELAIVKYLRKKIFFESDWVVK